MSLMSHKSREFDSDVGSIKGHEGRVTRSICIVSGVQHRRGAQLALLIAHRYDTTVF